MWTYKDSREFHISLPWVYHLLRGELIRTDFKNPNSFDTTHLEFSSNDTKLASKLSKQLSFDTAHIQFRLLFSIFFVYFKVVSVVSCIVKSFVNEVHYTIQNCKNLLRNIVICRICQVGVLQVVLTMQHKRTNV